MNTEFEVKEIMKMGISPEKKVEFIIDFTNFREEDIIKAIKEGGETPSKVYGNLVNLSKRRK